MKAPAFSPGLCCLQNPVGKTNDDEIKASGSVIQLLTQSFRIMVFDDPS